MTLSLTAPGVTVVAGTGAVNPDLSLIVPNTGVSTSAGAVVGVTSNIPHATDVLGSSFLSISMLISGPSAAIGPGGVGVSGQPGQTTSTITVIGNASGVGRTIVGELHRGTIWIAAIIVFWVTGFIMA